MTPEALGRMHEYIHPADPVTKCIHWSGAHNFGYPIFNLGDGPMHVSRIVLIEIGRWPDWADDGDKWHAHHTCFNGSCVNPYHLMWCTPAFHRELHQIARELDDFYE